MIIVAKVNVQYSLQKVASSRWVMLETILFGAILIYITVSVVLMFGNFETPESFSLGHFAVLRVEHYHLLSRALV